MNYVPWSVAKQESDWGQSLFFRARLERLDYIVAELARSWGLEFDDIEQIRHGRPITLDYLFPGGEEALGSFEEHFGKLAKQISGLLYVLFINGDTAGAAGFTPKCPRVADIWRPVFLGPDTTIYLSLATESDALLISCPRVPDILLGKSDGDFRDSLTALRTLGAEIVDRVNLLVPAARTLVARDAQEASP